MAERRLKLVVGAASGPVGAEWRSHADPGVPPGLARDAQAAVNYVVYWCACWISRVGRARLEAAARS